MGLDMYLTKRVYIGAEYDHNRVKLKISGESLGKKIKVNTAKVSYIIESAGYWRKAFAIHSWFVREVQDGEDECREHYVSFEKLQKLKALCEEVLKTKDPTELPLEKSWDAEIEDWYWDDLRDTIKIISELDPDGEYYYRSSW